MPAPQSPLIQLAIDESQLAKLNGNTHPLARARFDLGTAPATLPMQRMLLVLKRSAEQETALRKLLDDQQDKASPKFHKWLTPEQYGKQFGPSDSDMQLITSWLQAHGFQVGTTKGRTVLEFSGSASQVQEAFHTTIHKYIVKEEQHWANASDPSIPAALSPAVAGVLTLHNFLKKPQIRMSKERVLGKVQPGRRSALTFSDGSHGLAPLDFATIYDSPAYGGIASGSGVTIGVIGRSNLYSVDSPAEDVTDFRSAQAFSVCCGSLNIVLNGPDPGDLGGGDEGEATLDSTWTGAVAPNATIDLVVSASTNTSDGTDLSEIYIIENNLADVMTESFSTCEASATSSQAAGVLALAEQAAAQGITYFVSAGDNGAEGCDDPNQETIATGPVSVNLLASTPFNVAVGGTVFNEGTSTAYWSATNSNQESAVSYIPENVWNDSCLAATCSTNANIAAGSGGASGFFAKPVWQAGVPGIVNDSARDLPDVSLSAAPHDGYVLCLEASCVPDAQGQFFLALVGGTSASAPAFAGIMALVDQQMGGRQGVANYALYRLAGMQTIYPSQCNGSNTVAAPNAACIFHDVTTGNNAVPGELNYGLASAQYQAGPGYDLATGLGSVNIANLVSDWNTATFSPTTTMLSLAPLTGIPHGAMVTVNVGVTPTTGTTTPTGDVSLLASTGAGMKLQTAINFYTLNNGAVASSTDVLPGGTYSVFAHYAGDATYAPSDSAPVTVTVTPESSSTSLSILTFDANGNQLNFTSGPFGSFVYLRADVGGLSFHGTPTGAVTFADTFGTIPGGNSFQLNAGDQLNNGSNTATPNGIFTFDTGTHSISAAYAGDASFAASTSTPPVTFTITPGFFVTTPASALVNISAPGSSGTTSVTVSSSSGFSGTIALACSQLPTGATCQFSPSTITALGSVANTTSTITVATSAGTAMLQSPRKPWSAKWLALGSMMIFSLVLASAPKSRRASIGLTSLIVMLLFVPGCGGGSSSSKTPPPTPATVAGTYNVIVTASSGSSTSSSSFTLVVQ